MTKGTPQADPPFPSNAPDEGNSLGNNFRSDRLGRVYVGWPGPYGNPFDGSAQPDCVQRFCDWVVAQSDLLWLIRKRLEGRLLAHQRFGERSHAGILMDIASGQSPIRVPPEPVFVFGSGGAGQYGRLAAQAAEKLHGAQPGVGDGLTGNAYAVPIKSQGSRHYPLHEVFQGLRRFFEFASTDGADLTFRLTRIGCGLPGLPEVAIRNFCRKRAGSNVELPGTWLGASDIPLPRVIVAGSRTFQDRERAFKALKQVRKKLGDFEIVSGGAKGADAIGEEFAVSEGLPLRRFPADWEGAGRGAGHIRNATVAWYGTHLLAFHQNNSRGTRHMIDLARLSGLTVAVMQA